MITKNKNVIFFGSLIILLGTFFLIFLRTLLPLASHTIYYCQTIINSFSNPLPSYLELVPVIFGLLFLVFLSIAFLKLLFIYSSVRVLKKHLSNHHPIKPHFKDLLEKLQIDDKTQMIKSDKRFAFCLGMRNPSIYISTSLVALLSPQELEAVLRHEQYHLIHRDNLTMLLASVGGSLLPFFPLLTDLLHNFQVEREIQADAYAVQELGNERPLITALRKLLSAPALSIDIAASIAQSDTLEARIYALIKKQYPSKIYKKMHILISLCSVLIMSITAFAPVQAIEVHDQGEDVLMLCPHGMKCLNACKQAMPMPQPILGENALYTPVNPR